MLNGGNPPGYPLPVPPWLHIVPAHVIQLIHLLVTSR